MHDLMNLKMSRLEFLKLLGGSVASVMGLGFLMSFLSKMHGDNGPALSKTDGPDSDFGTRKFGI